MGCRYLYDEQTNIIICFEVFEGDVVVYHKDSVFQGTDVCPTPTDVFLSNKYELEKMYYDIVVSYLKDNAFAEDF